MLFDYSQGPFIDQIHNMGVPRKLGPSAPASCLAFPLDDFYHHGLVFPIPRGNDLVLIFIGCFDIDPRHFANPAVTVRIFPKYGQQPDGEQFGGDMELGVFRGRSIL